MSMPHPRTKSRRKDRGAALLIAIGLLAVFVILGFYYVNYMSLEWDNAHYEISRTRARLAAETGIRLAVADLQYAQAQDQTVQVLNRSLEYTLPVYMKQQGAGEIGFAESESYGVTAQVQIIDENARIDINHAPASVLQHILRIEGDKARAIVQSMPRQGENPTEGAAPEVKPAAAPAPAAWFLSVDELVDRGFVTPEQFAELDTSLLTAYAVNDHAQPAASLNVNQAPAPVLAAALNIAPEKAEELVAARPFKSLESFAAAVGKTPDTFNYRPAPGATDALPAEFTLQSSVFRLQSAGSYVRRRPAGAGEDIVTARVEAVIQLQPDGAWKTLHWALNPDRAGQ